MDEKKRDFLFTIMFALLILAANIYLFYETEPEITKLSVSGAATSEIPRLFTQSFFLKIVFIVLTFLILLIAILAYVKFVRAKKEDSIKISYSMLKEKFGKTNTDLDLLYFLLREKKKLKIPTISKIFKIDKEKALEWCRILESHDYVIINYPSLSEPEVEFVAKA